MVQTILTILIFLAVALVVQYCYYDSDLYRRQQANKEQKNTKMKQLYPDRTTNPGDTTDTAVFPFAFIVPYCTPETEKEI